MRHTMLGALGLVVATITTIAPIGPASAAPTCAGRTATIVGDDADNQLSGTDGPDVIWAGAGNDIVQGGGGNDVICGGDGADTIYGEAGNDTIRAGEGNDYIAKSDGDDRIQAGPGHDRLDVSMGADTVYAGPGDDVLFHEGHSSLCPGCLPQADGQRLHGGPGRDRFSTFVHPDWDLLVSGGDGIDTWRLSSDAAWPGGDLRVSLPKGEAALGGSGRVLLVPGIDNVAVGWLGERVRARVSGTSGPNRVSNESGGVTVYGYGGDDTVLATAYDDFFDGGAGFDRLRARATGGDDRCVRVERREVSCPAP